jgi:hypothetical protein
VGDQLVKSVTLHNKSKANVYVELSMVAKEGTYCDEELMEKQFKVSLHITLVRIC